MRKAVPNRALPKPIVRPRHSAGATVSLDPPDIVPDDGAPSESTRASQNLARGHGCRTGSALIGARVINISAISGSRDGDHGADHGQRIGQ